MVAIARLMVTFGASCPIELRRVSAERGAGVKRPVDGRDLRSPRGRGADAGVEAIQDRVEDEAGDDDQDRAPERERLDHRKVLRVRALQFVMPQGPPGEAEEPRE